jgi:ATP-dependent DNA helicase RecG
MEIPEWADDELSKELPILRSRGENQNLEYIEAFPQNVRELGKEIAAFATSNTGTILLGVTNNGELVGLQEASAAEGRDQLLRRIEGICKGPIKPAITPVAKFAVEENAVVLILIVPKGNQPVYYCQQVPYVRHITESRPAEPHEVLELIQASLARTFKRPEDTESDSRSEMFSDLARILINILIYGDQVYERNVNPWLEMWRTDFRYAASELRNLSVRDEAAEENLTEDLEILADALDRVGTFQMYMGCGPDFERITNEALSIARRIKEERIDPISLSESTQGKIEGLIISLSRKLSNLVSRVDTMIESGRIEELQSEASDIGRNLLQVSCYKIDFFEEGFLQELRSIARELHLVETMRLYMDGGRSLQAVKDRVLECSKRLNNLSGQLPT